MEMFRAKKPFQLKKLGEKRSQGLARWGYFSEKLSLGAFVPYGPESY